MDTILDLMQSGMTLALVPLSLGVRQEHIDTVSNLRTANTALSHTLGRVYPLAIAVQTRGPGLRIGGLKKVTSNVPLQFAYFNSLVSNDVYVNFFTSTKYYSLVR